MQGEVCLLHKWTTVKKENITESLDNIIFIGHDKHKL
jgi:hypothetical protein